MPTTSSGWWKVNRGDYSTCEKRCRRGQSPGPLRERLRRVYSVRRSVVGGVGCSVAKPRIAHLYASPQHVVIPDGTGLKIRYALSGSLKALKEGGRAYERASPKGKEQKYPRVGT